MANNTRDKLSELADLHGIILLSKVERDGEILLYVLTDRELDCEEKERIKTNLCSSFEPANCTVLFALDLLPQHLKQMIEESEIIYVRNKNLGDSIFAGILTLSLDFQYLVNERTSLIVKRKIVEALTSRSG